jgi:hypothetical protein
MPGPGSVNPILNRNQSCGSVNISFGSGSVILNYGPGSVEAN